jgi:hypothetical protein
MARQVKSRPKEALLVAGGRERPFPGAPRRHQGGGSRRLCVRPAGLVGASWACDALTATRRGPPRLEAHMVLSSSATPLCPTQV